MADVTAETRTMSSWFVSTLKYGGLVLAVVAAAALVHNQAVANLASNVATAGYSVLLIIGVLCVLAGANWERRFSPVSESAAGEPANPTNQRQHIGDAGLAGAADHYSARIKQILGMIETVENSLREKRKRIEEMQVRHEDLALEYTQLGQSLDSASTDLARQFGDMIGDLGSDAAIAKPRAGGAPAAAAASNMALEPADLPAVSECVRKARGTPNEAEIDLDFLQAGSKRMLKKSPVHREVSTLEVKPVKSTDAILVSGNE